MPANVEFFNSDDEDTSKCADLLDAASKIEEQERKNGIKNSQKATAPEYHYAFDGLHCVEDDCGIEIPPERLALNRVRCTECQAALEERRSKFRR